MYLFRRMLALTVATLLATGGGVLQAQSAKAVSATARISNDVDTGQKAQLAGHVPGWATAANDLGSVAPSRRLDNLHLVLRRSPEVQAAFEQLLADQQDPASPRYHQWLKPQQNAEQYGIAPTDLATVTAWLQSQGLSVDDVAAGGLFITFSGPVSSLENAFSTRLHNFARENTTRYAPTIEPAVPAALASVIRGIGGLSEDMAHVNSRTAPTLDASVRSAVDGPQPFYDSASGSHFVAPGDFNTIYDILPTFNAGINGNGNHVANLIDSRIAPADITGFNSVFGLAVAQPNQILIPGSADPGISSSSEGEAALDVQRILGTAPGATVDLLVFANLGFNNIYSALQYEIGTLNDPVVNMSFGACNSGNSSIESNAFEAYFKTGTAQGISFFVSSGDNAAAGCDSDSNTIPANQELATNLICASSYATCVGGTEFAEGSGSYWGANSATRVSATGYIPEGAWNEPTFVSSGKTTYQAAGTGGGVTNFPKPSWQTGTGVPADGLRDVPDVSFTASYHDGYLICQADIGNDCSAGTFKYIIFGTSASSPSMAGVAALLDQKLGARQGNLNPLFYKLAATPLNGVFHDVTVATSGVANCTTATPSMCNNSTPSANSLSGGLAGYAVGTGYDLATGLGSMDVTNFLAAASPATTVSTSLALTASANPITTAQTTTFTATLSEASKTSNPTGTVQFYSNGSALGSAVTLNASGTATTAVLSFPTAGTYAITAVYSGDVTYSGATAAALSLIVNPVSSFTIAPAATSLSLVAGSSVTDVLTASSVNSFTGNVALSCSISTSSGTAAGSCSIAPRAVSLNSNSVSSTLTINAAAGTSGVMNVVVTGSSGGASTASASIVVSVSLPPVPSFSITASPASLSFNAGATVGNTEGIVITPINGFSGTVALNCTVSGIGGASPPACSLTPATITLGGGVSANTIATISTVTASSVSAHASVDGGLPAGGVLLAALVCLMPFRKRRAIRSLAALLLILGVLPAVSGCGSGGTLTTAATSSSAGTYTVTISGTGTSSGSSTASTTRASFTLTVH